VGEEKKMVKRNVSRDIRSRKGIERECCLNIEKNIVERQESIKKSAMETKTEVDRENSYL